MQCDFVRATIWVWLFLCITAHLPAIFASGPRKNSPVNPSYMISPWQHAGYILMTNTITSCKIELPSQPHFYPALRLKVSARRRCLHAHFKSNTTPVVPKWTQTWTPSYSTRTDCIHGLCSYTMYISVPNLHSTLRQWCEIYELNTGIYTLGLI